MAGSAGRPRTPDAAIIDGARRALIANPRASMSEIARTAGVGMSAVYLRLPNREALLQHFADDANTTFDRALAQADDDLADGADAREVLERFVTAITDSGVLRLILAIAGTFARSEHDLAASVRLRDRGREFMRVLHARQVLRPDVTWEDLGKALEMIGSVDGADADRTAALRIRMTDVVVTGLTSGARPLAGTTTDATDFRENRAPDPPDGTRIRDRKDRHD